MKLFILLFGLFNLLLTLCQVDEEDVRRSHQQFADLMKHDGKKRILVADTKNINKLIKKNEIVLVFFWIDNKKESEKLTERDTAVLEVAAQVFEGRSVAICTCEILSNQKFAMAAGVRYTGMIKIFKRNKVTTYAGQRAPDVLIPYLSKMLEPPLKYLLTKSDKKLFDQNDLPKVIAYLSKNSKESKVYEEVALNFQPMVTFYVVHDAKVAKSFHLKKMKSVQFIKPYEKPFTYPAKSEFSEKAIVKFIESNKKQRLMKMRLENLHDIWAIDLQGVLVAIFANPKTDEGTKFFSQAKSLSKIFEKTANLSFVWIDPTPFPAMIDYWQKSFLIDPLKPSLGVVDIHKQTSAWFVPPNTDPTDFNVDHMKKWLNKYVAGDLPLIPMTVPTETEEIKIDSNTEEDNEDPEKDEL